MLDELQHRGNALLDLVATGEVNFVRTANRIADIVLVTVQRFVELAKQKSFFSRVRIEHRDGIDMAVSHAKNVIRLLNQVCRQHMTALLGDVDAKFLQRANRVFARRKPIDRSDSRRHDPEIISSFNGMPEEPLSHGTATDIAGADEKNCLHSANQSFELGEQADIRQRESTGAELLHHGQPFEQVQRARKHWIADDSLGPLDLADAGACFIFGVKTFT